MTRKELDTALAELECAVVAMILENKPSDNAERVDLKHAEILRRVFGSGENR